MWRLGISMHTEISIDVDAAPRRVFELARDVSQWPSLLPHYRKVTIHSLNDGHVTATMRATRSVGPLALPVAWRSEQWSEDSDAADLRLRFLHVGGATKGMDVTWHIRPTPRGGRVTIEHDFRRRLPLLGDEVFPWFVDRLFVRPIAGRTLAAFKRLAEAGS
jgi:ribosome-associated toxin RatA of RatAB toxin-antitoxin module